MFRISTSVGLRGFSGLGLYWAMTGNLLGIQRTKPSTAPEIYCVIRVQGTIAGCLCQGALKSINSFHARISFH